MVARKTFQPAMTYVHFVVVEIGIIGEKKKYNIAFTDSNLIDIPLNICSLWVKNIMKTFPFDIQTTEQKSNIIKPFPFNIYDSRGKR